MTKHVCVRDLSRNFYKTVPNLASLSEPVVITQKGNPVATLSAYKAITPGENPSVGNVITSNVSYQDSTTIYKEESISVFEAHGLNREFAEEIYAELKGKEVKLDEEEKHNYGS